jgi:hypothetical protein
LIIYCLNFSRDGEPSDCPLGRTIIHQALSGRRNSSGTNCHRNTTKLFFVRLHSLIIVTPWPISYLALAGPLTKLQLAVYQRILKTEDVQLLTRKDEVCDCDEGRRLRRVRCKCCYETNEQGDSWVSKLLKYMTLLLKVGRVAVKLSIIG